LCYLVCRLHMRPSFPVDSLRRGLWSVWPGCRRVLYPIWGCLRDCFQIDRYILIPWIERFSEVIALVLILPTGSILGYDYRRTARALGYAVDHKRVDDLSDFPIEHARLRTCKWSLVLCAPILAGYGWALQTKTVRLANTLHPPHSH